MRKGVAADSVRARKSRSSTIRDIVEDSLTTLVSLSVEVSGEGGAFTVPVKATSIRRAAEFAASSFPGSEVRVVFPIDGDGFFADDGGIEELGTAPQRHPRGN